MGFIENFFFSIAGLSYIFLWIVVSLATIEKKPILNYLAEFLVYLFSFLFLGLRDSNSGTDTAAYISFFEKIQYSQNFEFTWEYIYNVFAYLIGLIFDSTGFIIANVVIQLLLISFISRKLKIKEISLILLAYISFLPGFDMLTNGMRQGLSIPLAMIIYFIWQYKKSINKLSVFILFILHKSILIYIPFLIVSSFTKTNHKLKLINLFLSLFVIFILLWHLMDLRDVLSPVMNSITFQLSESNLTLGEKFNVYLTNDSDMLSGIYKYYFLMISIFFLFFVFKSRKEISEHTNNVVLRDYAFFVSFLALPYAIIWISPFSYRFMYIFYLPGLIFSVYFLNIQNQIKSYYFYLLVVLVAGLFTYGSNTFSNFNY
ncbi:EpsG family protein [Salegentibacter flavus]|uniref:EpsG family protein n=1 Tax=Salegentibacter flavus TaxID=287099 RepID=A0A1I5BP24_9FLAO|nr:EpsG family protein [Salegentibacter flavus]SFN76478.1 EpsG family protein [Salegentibacter flavus]